MDCPFYAVVCATISRYCSISSFSIFFFFQFILTRDGPPSLLSVRITGFGLLIVFVWVSCGLAALRCLRECIWSNPLWSSLCLCAVDAFTGSGRVSGIWELGGETDKETGKKRKDKKGYGVCFAAARCEWLALFWICLEFCFVLGLGHIVHIGKELLRVVRTEPIFLSKRCDCWGICRMHS